MSSDSVNTIDPVFCKHIDIPNHIVNPPKPIELCKAAAAVVGPRLIDGAQQIRGLWKIYPFTVPAKVDLVANGITMRGRHIEIKETNPFKTYQAPTSTRRAQNKSHMSERITIKDVCLSVDNNDLVDSMKAIRPDLVFTSEMKYSKERSDGSITDYRNGDRYIFVKQPITPPLPRNMILGNSKCRIFHESQETLCRACKTEGHNFRDESCPAYDPNPNVLAFRSYESIYSNMHECPECEIIYNHRTYSCTEKLFLSEKATDLGYPDIAEEIRTAKHGGAAKAISKKIPKDESDQWDLDKGHTVMEIAIDAKIRSCSHFREALIESGDKILAEATYHPLFASGLPPDVTAYTKPSHFPGKNILGAILMEQREKLVNPEKKWEDENIMPLDSARNDSRYNEMLDNSTASEDNSLISERHRVEDETSKKQQPPVEDRNNLSIISVDSVSFPSLSETTNMERKKSAQNSVVRGRQKDRKTRRTQS